MENAINKLQAYADTLTTKDISYLNINPKMDADTLYNLLKRGWWHIYFFGSNRDLNFGLRMTPDIEFSKWPVSSSYINKNSYIVAPSLDTFFYLNLANQLVKSQIIGHYSSMAAEVEKVSDKFLDITGGKEHFDLFKDFFINPFVFPENETRESELYVSFWDQFDNSDGHSLMREIIQDPESFNISTVGTLDKNKLGIWKHRIFYVIIQQACKKNADLINNTEIREFFWDFFKSINVYDCENMVPKQFPNDYTQPNFELASPIKMFALEIKRNTEKYAQDPLALAILKLDDDIDSYTGIEHAEAAALYDDQMNRPDLSWNCLVNAAYWSGLNSGETLLPAWEAAIYLAEKHNWTDAHYALKTQYEWYLDYKKKNNIS